MHGSSTESGIVIWSVALSALRERIQALDRVEELPALAADLRAAALQLAAEGMRSDRLTGLIAQWNDELLRALLRQYADAFAGLRWCWLALGSEGRLEQTLATDQDNALIFVHERPIEVRERLLPVLHEINQWLDKAGYRWCPGEVMASNPRWCLSLDEWKGVFASWIDLGDPASLLHGSIFFDFRGIAGELGLAAELRRWLSEYLEPRPVFLKLLAAQCLENHPPLTPWHSLRGRIHHGEKVVDVKLNGVSLLVDAARLFALGAGLDETSTEQRLRGAAHTSEQQRNAEAWIGAYRWLQDLRMRHQLEQIRAGEPVDNRVPLKALSRFDRRLLVAALLEAGRAQRSLKIRYQL